MDDAVPCEARARRDIERRADPTLDEVRRHREAEHRGDPVRPHERQEERDPAAPRRADQDHGPSRRRIEQVERIVPPATDRAVGNASLGGAVTGVVEAERRMAVRGREAGEIAPLDTGRGAAAL